jgi:hypothetical protein
VGTAWFRVREVTLGMKNEGHDQLGMIKLYALSDQPKAFGTFFCIRSSKEKPKFIWA